jgi:hypothetical protein
MTSDMVVTFQSSNHAIAAEYFCICNHVKMELIPTPREISSNCGFALQIYHNDVVKIAKQFTENGILFAKIFQIKFQNGEKYYEEKSN